LAQALGKWLLALRASGPPLPEDLTAAHGPGKAAAAPLWPIAGRAEAEWTGRPRDRCFTRSTMTTMATASSRASSPDEEEGELFSRSATSRWDAEDLQAPLPTLLAQERLREPLYIMPRSFMPRCMVPMVRVKNTFIECVEEGAEDGEFGDLGVRKTRTWSNSEDGGSRRRRLLAALEELRSHCGSSDRGAEALEELRSHCENSDRGADFAAEGFAEPEPEHEPLREPHRSEGSEGHETASCRPCAWFWRPQGCSNREGCRHCHLCPEGEVKRRRKANRASVRAQQAAAAQAAEDPEDSE